MTQLHYFVIIPNRLICTACIHSLLQLEHNTAQTGIAIPARTRFPRTSATITS